MRAPAVHRPGLRCDSAPARGTAPALPRPGQAPVHRAEGDGVGGAPVALVEEVRIAQQLRVAGLDAGLRPRRGVVHAERLIFRDGAAAEELEQGPPVDGEALPAPAKTVREELRDGPAELRWFFHHGVHERPRIATALALPQQLNFVGEQAPGLKPHS